MHVFKRGVSHMSQRTLESFKAFVKKHPGLIDEVKKGKWTWKELYEEWQIFGDKDERWNRYRETEETINEYRLSGILAKIKQIKLQDVHKNIVELKELVQTIQQFIHELQPQENKYSEYNRFPYDY